MSVILHFFVIFLLNFLQFVSTSETSIPLCELEFEKEGICKLQNHYDIFEVPQPRPVTLEVLLNVQDIIEVDEDDKSLTIFIDLKVFWNDSRLLLKTNGSNYREDQ